MERRFSTLLDKCPEEYRSKMIQVIYRAGEDIVEQGGRVKAFHYILDGLVKVFYETPGGKSHIQNLLESGDIFGELEVMQEKYGICTVQAIKDTTVLTIPREAYVSWISHDCEFAMFIMEIICNKFYLKSKKISEDALYPLQFRLINEILLLTKKQEKLSIEWDKPLVADELATSLRSLNRLIQELKDKGLVDVKKSIITVLDMKGLEMEKEKYL